MALIVKTLVSAETIRDGGSLATSFRDEQGADWILFLPLRKAFHEGQLEKLGFEDPVLIDGAPESRPADTSGRVYSVLSGPSSLLNWQEAQALTAQFITHAAALDEWAAGALNELCVAVASEGRLPLGMERFISTSEGRRLR
jgi:hypothetical protein